MRPFLIIAASGLALSAAALAQVTPIPGDQQQPNRNRPAPGQQQPPETDKPAPAEEQLGNTADREAPANDSADAPPSPDDTAVTANRAEGDPVDATAKPPD